MSGDDFDQVFGGRPAGRPTFAERMDRGPLPGFTDPREAAEAAPGIYKAFGHFPTGHAPKGCEVRRWIDATEIPTGIVFPYRLLMEITFTGEDDLTLRLPDTMIVIAGHHLDPLRQALVREHVTFIQNYNRLVWPTLPPKGETIIEQIDIVRP